MTAPRTVRGRLVQAGSPRNIKRIRVETLKAANEYTASVVCANNTQEQLSVTNLAEPDGSDGTVPSGTEALAMQVDGTWVAVIPHSAVFVARVVSANGQGVYGVREQAIASDGSFSDADGAINLVATNLAESGITPGNTIGTGTRVIVAAVTDTGTPATLRHVFNLPTSA